MGRYPMGEHKYSATSLALRVVSPLALLSCARSAHARAHATPTPARPTLRAEVDPDAEIRKVSTLQISLYVWTHFDPHSDLPFGLGDRLRCEAFSAAETLAGRASPVPTPLGSARRSVALLHGIPAGGKSACPGSPPYGGQVEVSFARYPASVWPRAVRRLRASSPGYRPRRASDIRQPLGSPLYSHPHASSTERTALRRSPSALDRGLPPQLARAQQQRVLRPRRGVLEDWTCCWIAGVA